jgi:exopolyphosphatase/guanosine-5'-triphosphate,3'-diphosphate pyrophosphatase
MYQCLVLNINSKEKKMARGLVNLNMLRAAKAGLLDIVESYITVFHGDVNSREASSNKGIVQLVAESPGANLTQLYTSSNGVFRELNEEVRLGFDVGSGATKYAVYVVDQDNNKILNTVTSGALTYKYQDCVDSTADKTLPQACMENGLAIMQTIADSVNINCNVIKCAGIATAWARNANNTQDYIQKLLTNKFYIYPITQAEEGNVGFQSLLANPDVHLADKNNIIVWDSGGGSFQLSTYNSGNIHIYNGPFGSANFQALLVNNGFPATALSFDQITQARKQVTAQIIDPIKADKIITTKVANEVKIYAIGGLMNFALKPMVYNPPFDTISTLNHATIDGLISRFYNGTGIITVDSFEELFPNINVKFFNVTQSNLLLLSLIMEGSGIDEVNIVETKANDATVLTTLLHTHPSPGTISDIWDDQIW